MATSMKTAELVNDTSRPPRWNSTRRLMAELFERTFASGHFSYPQSPRFISLAARNTLSMPAPAPRKKNIRRKSGVVPSQRSSSQPIPPPTSKAANSSTPIRNAKPDGGPGRRVWAVDSLVFAGRSLAQLAQALVEIARPLRRFPLAHRSPFCGGPAAGNIPEPQSGAQHKGCPPACQARPNGS